MEKHRCEDLLDILAVSRGIFAPEHFLLNALQKNVKLHILHPMLYQLLLYGYGLEVAVIRKT